METYTKADLIRGFGEAGLAKGETVFFQSCLHGLGQPQGVTGKDELCRFFLDALREVIGPEGTVVVPAFSTQVARQNQPFVVDETVPNYGLLPEYCFRHPDFVRSLHPMYSVSAWGPRATEICRSGGTSNFGAGSAFDVMVRLGTRNIFLAVEPRLSATIAHFMEVHYGVPYIYNKLLKWRPVEKGVVAGEPYLAAVRYLDCGARYDLGRFQQKLLETRAMRRVRVGGGDVWGSTFAGMMAVGYEGLKRDPYYFLEAPPEFDYGRLPYDGPSLAQERPSDALPDVEKLLDRARVLAPQFAGVLRLVLAKSSPMTAKALVKMVSAQNEVYFAEGESIVDALFKAAGRRGATPEKLVDSYLRVCFDTLKEQLEFRRSGNYTLPDFESAQREVYDNQEVMEYYVDGILLTQVLWENHWRLMRFARSSFFAPFCLTSRHHLEVGPGHGYFTMLALRFGAARATAFDVSAESVRHTSDLLETQGLPRERWEVRHQDVQAHIPLPDGSADTAFCGEVLEHIGNPAGLLAELRRVLVPGGAVYITTCANAPTIDHIYLFKSTEEIREMIRGVGFEIERDLEIKFGMIGDKPLINYGAVMRKR